MAKRTADAAVQVLGGYGHMRDNVVARLWRVAKLLEIGGGTLEAHHKNLSRELARNPALLRD
jgi:isovaleryl-CoA dehydrogenase